MTLSVISSLIEDGLAKAYILPGPTRDPFSGELLGMPSTDEIEENFKTYFYVTKEGMVVHLSDDAWWPLDEDQNLKKDWLLTPDN